MALHELFRKTQQRISIQIRVIIRGNMSNTLKKKFFKYIKKNKVILHF